MNTNTNTAHGVGGEILFRGVTKRVGRGREARLAVKNCSMTIERGRLTVLVGPSGCGKTTLVNLMAGYDLPDCGEILLDGATITGPGPDRLVVFQETALFPWMTTWENITYGPRVSGVMDLNDVKKTGHELLRTVGLIDFRNKYPGQLSGGMQRRAELARAMINQPQVMLMDEPFRGLDAMTRQLMQEYYARIFEENPRTNVFVTSELDEAIYLADTLIILSNRPASVKKIIPVEMERPRTRTMLTSQVYAEYKREALELLHEEALRSFAQGSVDAADFIAAFTAAQQE